MVTKKHSRPVEWPSHHPYSYGSTAVQEEVIPGHDRPSRPVRPKKAVKGQNIQLRRVAFLVCLVLSLVFVNIVLNKLYFTHSQALIQLKSEEAKCLDENETLKIDVERLRSPERITSIAEKKLGMKTARSNIYVRE